MASPSRLYWELASSPPPNTATPPVYILYLLSRIGSRSAPSHPPTYIPALAYVSPRLSPTRPSCALSALTLSRRVPAAVYPCLPVRTTEGRAVSHLPGVSVLELDRARHVSRCDWQDGRLRGGACVIVEGFIATGYTTEPGVALRCAPGSSTAVGWREEITARLSEHGCPLDEAPHEGFSLSNRDTRTGCARRIIAHSIAQAHTP